MYPVRTSVKALIVKDEHVLLVHCRRAGEDYYILPGGGQNHSESLHVALMRECREEIYCDVVIGELIHVRDFIAGNHRVKGMDPSFHQVEFWFRCKLAEDAKPRIGTAKDNHQLGVEWLPIVRIDDYPVFPKVLKDILRGSILNVYLGDTN